MTIYRHGLTAEHYLSMYQRDEVKKMTRRQLKKVEALSNDTEHVFECDSCVWVVHVIPERHLGEVQAEFDEHKCEEHSLNTMRRE